MFASGFIRAARKFPKAIVLRASSGRQFAQIQMAWCILTSSNLSSGHSLAMRSESSTCCYTSVYEPVFQTEIIASVYDHVVSNEPLVLRRHLNGL
jgi:hypothetical protein